MNYTLFEPIEKSFHNTTGLTGTALVDANKSASKQEDRILEIFKERKKLTAEQVYFIYLKRHGEILESSVKRSCSDLAFKDKLTREPKATAMGRWKRPLHYYTYLETIL